MSSEGVTLRVGSRASALAMKQTHMIVDMLQANEPEATFDIVQVVTHGDRFRDKPIHEMGDTLARGIFNTALEESILSGEADFTTCSFKDVQSDLRPNLTAVSVGEREDHRDVLVTKHGTTLAGLPEGAVIATSSPRRVSQLKAFRADLRFVPLRGNVTTRVRREAERYDGVVLAAAGLLRLGLEAHISEFIDEEILLPAPAQAAMGCEYRSNDTATAQRIAAIVHPNTEACVKLEKAMLVKLSGGCFAPIGVLAQPKGKNILLRCRIAPLDGSRIVAAQTTLPGKASPEEQNALLDEVYNQIQEQGGIEIVNEVRDALQPGQQN